MFKRLKRFKVEIIEEIDKSLCEWKRDTILLQIEGGKKVLNEVTYSDSAIVEKQLCIDGRPLYSLYSDNYYCPTCQKIIEEGFGLKDKGRLITDRIVKAQDSNLSLYESIELLKPLFKLFEGGLYILTRAEMYPVNGEGEFFWNSTDGRKLYEATAEMYYKCHFGSGYMSFLYPSQPTSMLDKETLQKYLRDESTNNTGLAYYMDGSMALLLDGHHRATTACLKQQPIECLTIARVNGYAAEKNKDVSYFWAGGTAFNMKDMKNKDRILKLLPRYKTDLIKGQCKNKKHAIQDRELDKEIKKQLNENSKKYPTFKEIAFESMLDEVTFERLEVLWDKYDEESTFEFELLIDVLYRHNKDKMFEYIKNMITDISKCEFWHQAYSLLLSYESELVEDLLVEYLVENEYDKTDSIRIMIDDYFKYDYINHLRLKQK